MGKGSWTCFSESEFVTGKIKYSDILPRKLSLIAMTCYNLVTSIPYNYILQQVDAKKNKANIIHVSWSISLIISINICEYGLGIRTRIYTFKSEINTEKPYMASMLPRNRNIQMIGKFTLITKHNKREITESILTINVEPSTLTSTLWMTKTKPPSQF